MQNIVTLNLHNKGLFIYERQEVSYWVERSWYLSVLGTRICGLSHLFSNWSHRRAVLWMLLTVPHWNTAFHWTYCCFVVVLPSVGWKAGFLIWVWESFFLEWYCPMACPTSEAVQWWWIRAFCRVKGPSRVRLTPLHAAVLRSSSPISCTTLRKYFWVSFIHCTSVRTEGRKTSGSRPDHFKILKWGFQCIQLKIIYLKWSWGAGSERNAGLSEWAVISHRDPVNRAQPSHRLPVSTCRHWNTLIKKKQTFRVIYLYIYK